ncbi:MAG: sulfur carrier protein ThiS [Myxococcota bacterium]
MELTINGEQRRFEGGDLTVADLVERLGLGCRRVAVEVNRQLVRRGTWEDHALAEGDAVEIVHFVGGG